MSVVPMSPSSTVTSPADTLAWGCGGGERLVLAGRHDAAEPARRGGSGTRCSVPGPSPARLYRRRALDASSSPDPVVEPSSTPYSNCHCVTRPPGSSSACSAASATLLAAPVVTVGGLERLRAARSRRRQEASTPPAPQWGTQATRSLGPPFGDLWTFVPLSRRAARWKVADTRADAAPISG